MVVMCSWVGHIKNVSKRCSIENWTLESTLIDSGSSIDITHCDYKMLKALSTSKSKKKLQWSYLKPL